MTKSSYGHVVTKNVHGKCRLFFNSPDLQRSRVTFQHASSVRENRHTFDHERPRPRRDSGARSDLRVPRDVARLSLAPSARW